MKDEEQITAAVMRLREFHAAVRREGLVQAFVQTIEDPFRPRTDRGTLRLSRILLLLAAMALLGGATFLFLSLVPR